MAIRALSKLAAVLLLAGMLAGCIDANLDIALTGPETAKATLLQKMRPDSFTMLSLADTAGQARWQAAVKAAGDAARARSEAEAAGKDASAMPVPPLPPFYRRLAAQFCRSGGLLKSVDGGASCLEVSQGSLDEIALGALEQQVSFTPLPDGQVRIALSTRQLRALVRPDLALGPEIEQSIPALFSGRRITIRFSGAAVSDTNMSIAGDAMSASQQIAILGLIDGTAQLPDEFYAVVQAP